jgi:hypothetical protein
MKIDMQSPDGKEEIHIQQADGVTQVCTVASPD